MKKVLEKIFVVVFSVSFSAFCFLPMMYPDYAEINCFLAFVGVALSMTGMFKIGAW